MGSGEVTKDEMRELYALGLPPALICARAGITYSSFYEVIRGNGMKRGERLARFRAKRLERIKANIAETPAVSMFDWTRAAA
jgi:hypothetical protein